MLLADLLRRGVQVWVEEGELCFRAPKGVVTPEIRDELVRRKSELVATLIPGKRYACTSFAQQRLWFIEELEPGSPLYTIAVVTFRVAGPLDVAVLERSLNEIVERHEALRTTFETLEGHPVQVVSAECPLHVEVIDLSGLPADVREREAFARARVEACRPFDLREGPLWRAIVIRLTSEECLFLLPMHHIVSDGWSLGVVARELSILYSAFLKGKPSPLSPLPIQYPEYAQRQHLWMGSDAVDEQLEYWKHALAGLPPVLELPTDRPRPSVRSSAGACSTTLLPLELLKSVEALSRQERATLFMTLLAGFKALLHHYTGLEDIAVGSPIAGRNSPELRDLIGFFVNTLVMRTDLSEDPSFRQLVRRVRETALRAYDQQDLPFDRLVEELHPERSLSHTPVFQVAFALQSMPVQTIEFPGLEFTHFDLDTGVAKFDLILTTQRCLQGLIMQFEYSTDLFNADTIERMAGHYQAILESAVANPEQRISALDIMTPDERRKLLVDWNQTTTPYPRHSCVHQLFEEQAARTPEAVAVEFGSERMTYAELNRAANRLAHFVIQRGVRPGSLVGLCMERTLDFVVSTLAILKAGAAYVPLDLAYPAARLGFMIEDAGLSLVLSQKTLADLVRSERTLTVCVDVERTSIDACGDENVAQPLSSDAVAYVIYTSGSTGTPKGVCVPHRAIVRLVRDTNYIELGPDDRVAQASNTSFDAATFELWGALLNGGRLVIVPRDVTLSPPAFAEFLAGRGITALFLTTALFNETARQVPDAFRTVKHVLFGGEAADPRWAKTVLEQGAPERLLNVYGPTESTTFATWYPVENVADDATHVPIGRPLANTTLYVLDRNQRPVPIGVPGELYIGGDGLAQGYLNRPELTASCFVANPFSETPGERLYRTGDRVRYLSDGSVQFLGRFDDQVKIRGFRIELGEIESVLLRHGAVEACAVLAREDTGRGDDAGEKRLAAYFVADAESDHVDGDLTARLRKHLAASLPEYMVPSVFVRLDALPLTPNGKVDWRALPAPEFERKGPTKLEAPRTDLEREVAAVWSKLLRLEEMGVHENFFEIGGHSLMGVQLLSDLNEKFRVQIPLRAFFEAPTIAGLAAQIESVRGDTVRGDTVRGDAVREDAVREDAVGEDAKPLMRPLGALLPKSVVPIQSRGTKRPLFFAAPGGGVVFPYYNLVPYLEPDRPFYGLQDPSLDHGNKPFATVEELAAHYVNAMREVQPEGPYLVGGWSFGGFVAFEMAQQLHHQEQDVALLAIIDTPRAGLSAAGLGKLSRIANSLSGLVKYSGWVFRNAGPYIRDAVYVLTSGGRWRKNNGNGKPTLREYFGWFWLDAMRRICFGHSDVEHVVSQDSDLLSIRQPTLYPIFRVNNANIRSMRKYAAQRYRGRITLLRAEDRPFQECEKEDASLGWGDVAAEGVDVRMIPGNHVTMFRRPSIESLGAHLRDAVEQTESEPKPVKVHRPSRAKQTV